LYVNLHSLRHEGRLTRVPAIRPFRGTRFLFLVESPSIFAISLRFGIITAACSTGSKDGIVAVGDVSAGVRQAKAYRTECADILAGSPRK
jgi:hypothetical protein